jgi:hypothetical protein
MNEFLCKRLPAMMLLGLLTVWGCATNKQPSELNHSAAAGKKIHSTQLPAAPSPTMIYVTDFYLDPDQIQQDRSVLRRDGLVAKRMKRFRRGEDSAAKAAKLIRILSETITKELNQAGQPAKYCPNSSGLKGEFFSSNTPEPKEGWVVGGWFKTVDEGNRLIKATVGFGTGVETIKIQVAVSDLTKNVAEPFLFIGTANGAQMMPGGLVSKNPYVVAAKYVMAKGATEKDVKKQASSIAKSLMEYISKKPTS